jgi:putative endonuclease
MDARRVVGDAGEDAVAKWYAAAGYTVLARNWRVRAGELDLVLRSGGVLVFCEVKTRRGDAYGRPAEAIRPDKVRRLRRLATRWLAESEVRPRDLRFDVVEVLPQARGATLVEHIRAAF